MYQLQSEAVLNGIAYDPDRKRLFVTGKLWPQIYEIELIPRIISIYGPTKIPKLNTSPGK
jgi:diketogulonate reductase-like aldo/keto reductase